MVRKGFILRNFFQVKYLCTMKNIKNSSEQVKLAMIQIQNYGGENNIMRIEMPNDYYIQLICDKGSEEILIEAVSNNFLEETNRLKDSSIKILTELGWEAPKDENENFKIEAIIKNEIELNSIVEIITKTLKDVYGHENITQNMIELELDN